MRCTVSNVKREEHIKKSSVFSGLFLFVDGGRGGGGGERHPSKHETLIQRLMFAGMV